MRRALVWLPSAAVFAWVVVGSVFRVEHPTYRAGLMLFGLALSFAISPLLWSTIRARAPRGVFALCLLFTPAVAGVGLYYTQVGFSALVHERYRADRAARDAAEAREAEALSPAPAPPRPPPRAKPARYERIPLVLKAPSGAVSVELRRYPATAAEPKGTLLILGDLDQPRVEEVRRRHHNIARAHHLVELALPDELRELCPAARPPLEALADRFAPASEFPERLKEIAAALGQCVDDDAHLRALVAAAQPEALEAARRALELEVLPLFLLHEHDAQAEAYQRRYPRRAEVFPPPERPVALDPRRPWAPPAEVRKYNIYPGPDASAEDERLLRQLNQIIDEARKDGDRHLERAGVRALLPLFEKIYAPTTTYQRRRWVSLEEWRREVDSQWGQHLKGRPAALRRAARLDALDGQPDLMTLQARSEWTLDPRSLASALAGCRAGPRVSAKKAARARRGELEVVPLCHLLDEAWRR